MKTKKHLPLNVVDLAGIRQATKKVHSWYLVVIEQCIAQYRLADVDV